MAIAYLNVAIIGRSGGRSAVAASAYASRTDLVDERTGTAYRYARKSGDLVTSFLWLPKGAPERFRDRATLWNEVEKIETHKKAQTARRIILALPHELTEKQRQQLLQDFVKENFTRKGLAVDASIHQPDAAGDERNEHAHLLIPTRLMDKDGLGKKDRESSAEATGLEAWRRSWVKLANKQLERYGHAARITFEVAEGQEPQKHMGPEATALERQGIETEAGDDRLQIIDENQQAAANDNELDQEAPEEPAGAEGNEFVDRDRDAAESQFAIDAAGIKYGLGDVIQAEQTTVTRRKAERLLEQVERVEARLGMTRADLQSRHLEEMGVFHGHAQRQRQILDNQLAEQYGGRAEELARQIEVLSRQKRFFPKWWGRVTGKAKAEASQREVAQQSLDSIEARRSQRKTALADQQQMAEWEMRQRQQAEVWKLEAKPSYQESAQRAEKQRENAQRDLDGPELG